MAGFLDTAAAGIFFAVCFRTLRTSQEPKGIQDNFLIALFQLSTSDTYSLHMIRGAANHGYTIGFVTMIIIGYSMKMIPVNIWVTMTGEVVFEVHKIREITGNETVYALTEQFPQIIPILKEVGFEKITNPMLRKTLGRTVTLRMACREQQIDLNEVKGRLKPFVTAAR